MLAATANPFVISLTNGVTGAVNALTEFKQRLAKIKRDPVPDHVRVYDAIAAKDADAARDAMVRLIRLAVLDVPKTAANPYETAWRLLRSCRDRRSTART